MGQMKHGGVHSLCVMCVLLVAAALAPVSATSPSSSPSSSSSQSAPTAPTTATTAPISVVDLTAYNASSQGYIYLAVQAAAGLRNRAGPLVYVLSSDTDSHWLDTLRPSDQYPRQSVDAMQFIQTALSDFGGILYDETVNNGTLLLPSVVTLAGVLTSVPFNLVLQDKFPDTRVIYDTRVWQTQEDGVAACEEWVQDTTSLAFQQGSSVLGGYLVDWLVKEKIFTQYLPNACITYTADNTLLRRIVDKAPWPRPVRVYGYNSAFVVFGGDLFEAETDCIDVLGQVATEHSSNLAFWSMSEPLPPGTVLEQAPPGPHVTYDASKSYVALVYGDMDNIDFVQGWAYQHMMTRAARCGGAANGTCFPFTWTMSPNLIRLAPAILQWYYTMALQTGGRDWFIMPPSGTLYSYPGQMPSDVQAQYVLQQNEQAAVMNTSGAIHWEWFYEWESAWSTYFPRYVGGAPGGTRAFFLNDVPWPIPILDMWLRGETYRFIGEPSDPLSVVAFKPAFNWQEDGGGGIKGNSTAIAEMVNALEKGSVQYIYIIQNTPIESVFDMAAQLQPHVQLVGYEQLVDLARQRQLRTRV